MMQYRIWGISLLTCLVLGCGSDQVYHLSGSVTFQGQPIPDGYLVFEPDGSLGNSGQTGRSKIQNGKYNTRNKDGMAVIGGPHVIRILAHTATEGEMVPGGGEEAMPTLLFPPTTFKWDLPKKNDSIDFDFPLSDASQN